MGKRANRFWLRWTHFMLGCLALVLVVSAVAAPSRSGELVLGDETGPEALALSARLPDLIPDETSALSPEVITCPATVLPSDGSASGNGRGPIANIRYERTVYLITAGELLASGFPAGGVAGIGWNYSVAPGVAATSSLSVYLENTADATNLKSTTWATAIGSMTLVHNASTPLPNASGPFDISFTGGSAFSYTGGGLYVAFDWQYPAGTLGTGLNACTQTLAAGTKSGLSNTAPVATGLTSSAFRAETRLTSSIPTASNDASVDFVIAHGSLPVGLVGAQTVQAVVTNNGTSPLTNLPVTLNITGPDALSNQQVVPSLAACGGRTTVSFLPFLPSTLGSDTLTASVPADDVVGNNSKSRPLDETIPLYSYQHPGTTSSGGIGFANGPGIVVSKFTTTGATAILAVKLEFFAALPTTYRVAIYPDSGSSTPGTSALYVDAADRTVAAAGPVTLVLPVPVGVGPGNFYVGIQQTNAVNASLGIDPENPVRSGKQFLAIAIPPVTWVDFSPGNNFKMNIGVVLDRCLATPSAGNNGPICAGATLQLSASAAGAATYSWTGPNGFSSSLQNPTIPNATTAATGLYTVTVNGCPMGTATSATVLANGTSCNDANACTNPDTCSAGVCQGPNICTVVNPGIDLFSTPSTGSTYDDFGDNPIPGGFFNPGSDPFDGIITFRGLPLGGGLGLTDTIVKRNDTALLPGPGGSDTIDIEIVALSFVSINPVTVTYGGGSPETWNVRTCLSTAAPQTHGTMTLTAGACPGQGGTFTSTLYITPRLVFTRQSDSLTRVFDLGAMAVPPIDFHNNSGHWVEIADPALTLTTVAPGAVVDGNCDGVPDAPLPGTSNFFPGVRSADCSGLVALCGPQKKRLTAEDAQTYAAGHYPLPAQGPQDDSDADGIVNDADNCTSVHPSTYNPGQEDADDDGIGDICDNCPNTASCDESDSDRDGDGNICDNCVSVANPTQADLDHDGIGDVCDPDRDGDGIPNAADRCPDLSGASQTDSDGDLLGDDCDNCDFAINYEQRDFDHDGEGDACDNNDGEIHERPIDKITLTWDAEQGFTSWNVYIGAMDALRGPPNQYTQLPGSNPLADRHCGLGALTETDPAVPALGKLSFSLVSGVAGAVEGTLGSSTAGIRPNANPCP